MEFRLLGPLEVLRDGRVLAVGGAKQRALLALLLLHANEVVSRDRLIDELWSERQPGTADHSLDVQVSRLRKALEPDEPLETRGSGYMLTIDPEQVDARRFEHLLEEGRRANAAGKPAQAASLLREALGLWRGDALADLAYEAFAATEIERLEELRLVAIEERIDAELALGQHATLVSELEALTARHPLRERLRAQLMLALYRSGRQAEALRVYADARKRLVEELGLEPGQPLRELEQGILRQDPLLAATPPAAGRKRRRTVVTAIALPVGVGVVAAGVLLWHSGTQSSHAQPLAQPESVTLIAAKTGRVVGNAPVTAPVLSRFGAGALWSVSFQGDLTRIDLATHKTVSIGLGIAAPCGLTVGAGSVWVTDCSSPKLVRVDPKLNPPVATSIPLPTANVHPVNATGEVALGAGSVWVGQGQLNPGSWVDRFDPATGKLRKRIAILGGAQALSFADGAVWVVGSAPGYLTKIDARTNKIVARIRDEPLHGFMCCVAAGGGFVWVAIAQDQVVWKIGADGKVLASTKLAGAIENLSYGNGAVWASETGAVVRIDAITNTPRTYPLGHQLFGVAVRKGLFAVGVQETDEERGDDVVAGLKGRIVRVALGEGWLDTTDPLFTPSWNYARTQFQYATCAKLLNYPDASGAAGAKLVPEVAAAWPKVTDGGRTYTFRIRRDYRFAPSNEPVTAESFRHAIERALSPSLVATENDGYTLVSDVVGALAYRSGNTRHITGISTRSDTLVIRLSKPAPDLPRRLARPTFCAVPADTLTPPDGVSSPIPSAGPYYLAARAGNAVVLKRNPYYHGPRPHQLDAIVFRSGLEGGKAASLVTQGMFDYVSEFDPALAPNTAAAQAAGQRYRLAPTNGARGLAFNTARPLFADIRLRRAVEYALDRRTLTGNGDAPATRLLTENLPGFEDTFTYPLSPQLRTARRLVGGRHVHAVLTTFDLSDPREAAFAKSVREQLAAVGISVELLPRTYDDPLWNQKLSRADLATWSLPAEAGESDSASYLAPLPYLPAAAKQRLAQIQTLSYPRRDIAAAALAAKLEKDVMYAVIGHGAIPELVSSRLGCVIHQPEYPGVDLAALCIRKAGS
jgi:DNA-binding SARP family transcriptional activator/ABC-type transport system substrate-binding protein